MTKDDTLLVRIGMCRVFLVLNDWKHIYDPLLLSDLPHWSVSVDNLSGTSAASAHRKSLNSTPKDHIGRAPIDNERNSWCNFRIESGENHVAQGNTHCDNEKESNDIDHGLDGSKLQWFWSPEPPGPYKTSI